MVIYVAPSDPATIERQKREALFPVLDTNTDAVISRSEADAHQQFAQAFERLDRDRSGGIDPQEFARVRLEERAAAGSVPLKMPACRAICTADPS